MNRRCISGRRYVCGSQARVRVKNWEFVYHSSVENSGVILRRKNHSFGANLLVRESGKIPHFPAEFVRGTSPRTNETEVSS